MKKKILVISMILLLITIIAGSSMAWLLYTSGESLHVFKMGTIEVKVVESGFAEIIDPQAITYDRNVQAKSLGTMKTYVRVRLVPEWSNPSLPVSNVVLNLSTNGDWTSKQSDGYYYFKYYLTENQKSSLLLNSIEFIEIGPEYEGASFTLKVVTEGVPTTYEAWKNMWGLTSLPFTPDQAWTP